jgi:hypothetical protein
MPALVDALQVHLAADDQEQLEEADAVAHQQPLEVGRVAQELGGLLFGAEAHGALDAGAIVPGAVE